MNYSLEQAAREARHTALAIILTVLVALSSQLTDAADFSPVFTVGFAVTIARSVLTVLITAFTRIVDADSPSP